MPEIGQASRGKIGFARGDLLECSIGQAEMEVAGIVQGLGHSRPSGGADPNGDRPADLKAGLAPILHRLRDRLVQAEG